MSEPRLLFVAQPTRDVLARMKSAVSSAGLDARLGVNLFAPANWHQSLSGRYPDAAEIEKRLLRAGGRIAATAFTLTLNRFKGRSALDSCHWALLAEGWPARFDALLAAVRAAVLAEGLPDGGGHSPHVTISYAAPGPLPSIKIAPIDWPISEVLLVRGEGTGANYRYSVLARWLLLPNPDSQCEQLDLF